MENTLIEESVKCEVCNQTQFKKKEEFIFIKCSRCKTIRTVKIIEILESSSELKI